MSNSAFRLFVLAAALGAGCGGIDNGTREIASVNCNGIGNWTVGTSYSAGTAVSYNGKPYQCVQSHTAQAGWSPDAVPALWAPAQCSGGTSTGGGNTGGGNTGGGNTGGGNSGGSCNASTWTAGTNYNVGDVVKYPANGQYYKASHQNPGYDPTISTWFWDPTSCSGGGGSTGGGSTGGGTTGGGSCNAPNWTAGTNYNVGDVVKYPANGQYYKASHQNPGYDPTISTWFWDPSSCSAPPTNGGGGGTTGGGGGTTGGGSGLAAILSESTFNSMFPSRSGFYTYQGLVAATASYSTFATSGDSATQKREVAAFLANVAHETGGLVYVEEIVKGDYCQPSAGCPCAPGKQYYGRGPIQISWNYNYCAAGQALGLNLQAQPELVAQNATIAWQTGLWFWMTAGGTTCHNAMMSTNFGQTIRTINGGLECNGNNVGEMQDRVQYYQRFCQMLGVDPGASLTC